MDRTLYIMNVLWPLANYERVRPNALPERSSHQSEKEKLFLFANDFGSKKILKKKSATGVKCNKNEYEYEQMNNVTESDKFIIILSIYWEYEQRKFANLLSKL